jgi:hypothetical protein
MGSNTKVYKGIGRLVAEKTIWVLRRLMICITLVLFVGLTTGLTEATGGVYGEGLYGSCTYSTCAITLTSSSTVNINVVPGSSSTCTVNDDSVSITTDSSTGYTISFTDTTTSNSLVGSTTSVPAISASQSSPAILSANTWGYRVDGIGGFGSGPTSAVTNASTPSVTFAQVPTSTSTPDTLATSTSPADPAVTTDVWYGLCVDQTTPAGSYSGNIVYTAVVN